MLSNKKMVLQNRAIRIAMLTLSMIFLVMVPNMRVSAKDSINKTQEDIYGIGSVSKMFTTVAVMKLADEGLIDLDSSLTEYIPEFHMADSRYVKITPRMLLNHSSGIMGTTFKNAFVYGNSDTKYHDSILDQLSTQKLKAEPGAFCVYCNDGFTLAELLVERVSGLSFSEYVSRKIVNPLELKNTVTPGENLINYNVKPLYFGDKKLAYENVQLLGSGGIYSSPQDLCRFSQIFMKKRVPFLSDESLKEMETPYSLQGDISAGKGNSQYGYGLGWDSVNCYPYSQYGVKALSKGGSTTGYYTNLTVLPDNNLSIGQAASTQPLGEKIERSKIDKDTDLAWQKRDGKKYFIINEKYNSSNYLLNSSFKLERLKHTPEFLKHQEYVGACRIIDKDNAMALGELPIMLGRDMADYHFYNKNNNEYLQLGSITYIS